MTSEEKRHLWRRFVLLLFPPVLISIVVVYTGWAATLGNLVLANVPAGAVHGALARVHGIGGGAAVAGIVSVWILSPLVAGAGYLLMRRIVGEHIVRVTPPRKATALFRGMVALLLSIGAVGCVLFLPGKDSSRCPGCEQALVPLILLGHLQTYGIGGLLGYVACMRSIINTADKGS